MTFPTRKVIVTYAGVVFGEGSSYFVDASETPLVYDLDVETGKFSFECDVIVSETTEATFKNSCTTLEDTWGPKNKNAAFTIAFGSNGHESFDPSSNTGFNASPWWSKPGSDIDSGLSRRYRVGLTLDVPYTQTGKNGRRNTRLELSFTDARRRGLVVSGIYTALSSNQAYKQYDASVSAFAAAILTALGGTWEGPLAEKVSPDYEYDASGSNDKQIGKVLSFRREYQELIYNNAIGTLADVRLRRHELAVTCETSAPGDYAPRGQSVFRLKRLNVRYSVAVDFTQTQDLDAIYAGTVKPFLVDEARKAAGGGSLAVTFHAPEYDRVQNLLKASATVLAASGKFVQSRVVTTDDVDPGKETLGVWSGEKFAKKEFDNPGTYMRMVTWEYEVFGNVVAGAAAAGGRLQVGGGNAFGVFGNVPLNFQVVEGSDAEAGLDNFFGIAAVAGGGGGGAAKGDDVTPDAGSVPPPAGLRAIAKPYSVRIEPITYGAPGERQFTTTRYTKTKRWEFIRDPKPPSGGDNRVATHAFGELGELR